MQREEFNKKFNLSKDFYSKIKLSKRNANSNNIAGKPQILMLEIIKRFFKNPVVLISTIIFCALIITAICVYYFSPYQAGERLDANWDKDYKTSNIGSLPPQYVKWVKTDSTGKIGKTIAEMLQKPYAQYTAQYAKYSYASANKDLIYYNPYLYQHGAHLLALIKKFQHDHTGVMPNANEVEAMQKMIRPLHSFLGTTETGSDIWTTVWVGTLQSMKIALIVAVIETVVGVAVGCYLGFHAGKWIDTVMMRVIEIFQAPPSIIWLLLFVSIWGTSDWILIAGLLFVGWTWPIGSARMFMITVKDEEYILAAKSIGASTTRQIYLHALPAIAGKLAMNFVRRIPSIILSVASLAFLGFFKGDNSNLGSFIINNVQASKNNPWLIILPTLILLTLSVSLQFVAIGLHDALDPKVKAR